MTQTNQVPQTGRSPRSDRMPVLFVGHGSPMNAIGEGQASITWDRIATELPHPHAVLCVSAHWFVPRTAVNDQDAPRQIYDMYGFPQALYDLKYPAPGAPDLARRVIELLGADQDGSPAVQVDDSWGMDHGAWSVLRHLLPKADVPLTQLSVNSALPATRHLELGRALAPLREEGVLIVASGNVVHNLGLAGGGQGGYPWADRFSDRVRDLVLAGDATGVAQALGSGRDAALSAEYPDHFLPLLYALGAADAGDHVEVFNDYREMGSISMTSFLFSPGSGE